MSEAIPVVQAKVRLQRRARAVFDGLSRATARRTPIQGTAGDGLPARIGVLLQWGIGDAVLDLPFLQALSAACPGSSVELIGKPWLEDLFRGERFLSRVHPLVPPWTRYSGKYRVWEPAWRDYARSIAELRAERFDLLVALRFDPREIAQLRLLRADRTAGFAAAGGRGWITDDLALSFEDFHRMHRSAVAAHAAERLTGLRVSSVPQLAVPVDAGERARSWLRDAGHRAGLVLAVHNGAGASIRSWGWKNIAAALRTVPSDTGLLVFIDDGNGVPQGRLPGPPGIPSVVFRGTLTELKALLALCDVLVCNDSGVMHMAAAVGCRVVPVFGPTLPLWFGPAGPGHRLVIAEPMPCRPCMDRCVLASPLCMESVTPDMVAAALRRALADAQGNAAARMDG